MKRLVLILSAVLLSVAVGASTGVTQERGTSEYEALRARWLQKSPEERDVLQQRFEQLSKFQPDVQRELRRRAHDLQGTMRALESAPPPWVRERLDGAAPGERERELRRCVEDQHRRRGSSMRNRLPPDLRQRLEQAKTDEERAKIFEELFRRGREEMFPLFIERVAKRLGLDQAELTRLRATPANEQEGVLAGLKRRMILKRGRPTSVEQKDWDAWQLLSDKAFLEQVRLSGAFWRGRPKGDGSRRDDQHGPRHGPQDRSSGGPVGDRPASQPRQKGERDS